MSILDSGATPKHHGPLEPDRRGLTFRELVDRVFWGGAVVIMGFAGMQIQTLVASVQTLTQTVAVMNERIGTMKEGQARTDSKVTELEKALNELRERRP